MVKKLTVLVLLLILVVGGFVYAQTRQPELTEEQWVELEAIWSQNQKLNEEMLDKMVEFGAISSERTQWMRDHWKLLEEESYDSGTATEYNDGFGYGPCHGNPMAGRGWMGGPMMRGARMGSRMGGWR